MKLVTLDEINKVYQCAARYTVHRHRIKYNEFGQFCIGLNSFRNRISEAANDLYWQKYFSYLRHFRFGLCAAPFLNDYRDSRILEIYNDLSDHLRRCSAIYPDFAQPAWQLLALLKNLYRDGKNPLLDKLVELSKSKQYVAWVVKESRFISHVDEAIQADFETLHHVEAIHHTQLSASKCYDTVIVIGSPRWFPDNVFTSPRANTIDIVQYSWMRDTWRLPETFVAPYTPTRSKHVAFTEDNTFDELEIPAESLMLSLDNEAIVAHTSQESRREYEEIEARCVVLEGEQAIFIGADDSTNILIIDIDEEEDNRVRAIPVRELRPGTFILVRTSGGGDYIIPIADQIMGLDASLARQRQHEWKQLLKEYVIKHGLQKTCMDLLHLGSNIANEINVRNWMFPRNIKTRSRTDFLSIMRLVGLENQATEYWNTMEFINRAHRKAGYQLRRMLLSQVDKIASDEFKRHGKIEFKLSEHDDDARLTAFRIENILPETYTVSFSRIGVPFKLGS